MGKRWQGIVRDWAEYKDVFERDDGRAFILSGECGVMRSAKTPYLE